jgi:hypothetical protein
VKCLGAPFGLGRCAEVHSGRLGTLVNLRLLVFIPL